MYLFTDSKDALREAVCRPAERLSPSEIALTQEVDLQPGARKICELDMAISR